MSQRGHDPHGYNPHELSTPLPQGQSSLLCQQDHSDLLINAKPTGAISYQYPPRTKLVTINSKPIGMILTVISTESLYKLMYLRFICYKLKLIEVITISTWLSISHD